MAAEDAQKDPRCAIATTALRVQKLVCHVTTALRVNSLFAMSRKFIADADVRRTKPQDLRRYTTLEWFPSPCSTLQ